MHLDRPPQAPAGVLALGHGARGGVDAIDLRTATDAALDAGWAVARVVQPYRLAGRRSPAPSARLDEAWLAAVGAVRRRRGLARVPLVVGGRSSGARVACRTARAAGAAAVLALAFPLRPPGRPGAADRSGELADAGVPVVVVQGDRDAFGSAPELLGHEFAHVTVIAVEGADHALRTSAARHAVADAVGSVFARTGSAMPR